jgi:N-acetyl-anhydromuramyl-L-alanine amidase AmpD
MVAKEYKKSIATLAEHRNQFADHNMAGYKSLGYEVYSMAKLTEEAKKTSFQKHFRPHSMQNTKVLMNICFPELVLPLMVM